MSDFEAYDDFDEAWADVKAYVGSLQDKITDEGVLKKCLKEVGQQVSKLVKRYAPSKSQNPSYSDVKGGEYKHIIDDIKFSVKRNKLNKQWYVSVHGGKWTGYKWLWLNDGHLTTDGDWVEGNHFVDKAEAASIDVVNNIVDKYLQEALKD